ncbi:MAG: DMT family transporter [Pseudomonadota bacterium]
MITQAQAIKTNEWALLVLLSLLWGGAFIAAGLAVEELPPLTVVLARVGLAVAVLLPLFWFQGHSMPRTFAEWVPFLGMGLLNNVLPFGFFFAGLTFISVSLTSIINALTPLFTILVMACFRQEPLTLPRLTGVLLGALGVSFIQGFDGGTDSTQAIGILLCLCGACSYGFAALWGRYYLQGVAPL